MKNRNLFILGTRPEIIKISPLLNRLRPKIILTGQHQKKEMIESFLPLIDPSEVINLDLEEFKDFNNKRYQIGNILKNEILKSEIDNVFVLGDTNTTLIGAIAAKESKKKLFFLESGLRTYDLEQVEEYNRLIVSHLADINFCNHQNNVDNLISEGISENKIILSGSTVYSALMNQEILTDKNNSQDFILLTLHRPENVDNNQRLSDIITSLKELNYKIIFPIHPRTKNKLEKYNNIDVEHLSIVDSVDYQEFIELMNKSKFIISDSGGLQEESMILRKPLLIPRKFTERPEMLNVFNLLTYEVNELISESKSLIDETSALLQTIEKSPFLYGDDKVIDKMINSIK